MAGHGSGAEEVYKHQVSINADQITEVDKDSIPSGKLKTISMVQKFLIKLFVGNLLPVAGTIFDLRIPKILGEVIHKIPGYLGYDHNFCVTKGSSQENSFVARAVHPPTGLRKLVETRVNITLISVFIYTNYEILCHPLF